ncbi:DUF1176 domain-containing protein [Roseibium sediminicola]|uniref:DUF1176 domain-containing protein n=1 Tax=Roseibium sediminicola TaxID=2933272 RepID=A0ABT0GT51_9HYPH|nr:DUF1176 domain-containing protein [Roseibium sp. CAU 1639]MCK7612620.1 DUF1176 domain-containing protein [Roseibium sp. CAU 1639]
MRFVLSVLMGGLTVTPAAAELARTGFGDWSVSCNAKNYCIAETEGDASNGEDFRLKIERSAKADGDVYVTFDPTTTLSEGLPARIEIESLEEDNYGYFGKVSKVYKGNEMTFGGDADRDLMEKLRMGEEAAIQIEFGGSTGTLTYEISLKGLTHALLKIDSEQGRIGRTDAIVAWGGLPAGESTGIAAPSVASAPAAAPPAPAPDTASDSAAAAPVDDLPPPIMPSQETNNSGLDRGPQGQVYAVNEIPDEIQMMGYRTLDCQLEETVPAFGATYFAEGDVETWIVPCQMADANVPYYMATHIPFNPSLDEWKEFETPPGFNQPNHALVNNLFYDPSSGQVTGTTYYSPNYDCGTFERHEVEAESGNYILVEYLEKSSCDGVTGPPEGWPLNWTIDEMGD